MESIATRGCTKDELLSICEKIGLKQFRATQLFQWVQQKAVGSWEDIKNIGKGDQQLMRCHLHLDPLELVREQRSADGTRKYLFRLTDRETIECVLMDYSRARSRDRQTVCVSTQVGCAVGCAFCATGLEGFKRNLSVSEIVGQVLDITHLVRQEDSDFQVTNIVFMGMGEPLLNYDQVLKAIRILNDEQGQSIGMRRMTISTCGVVPQIIQLAKDNPQVGLAISLHTARDAVRDNLIPMNRRYPLNQLMQACKEYTKITHRRVTFEVALTTENAKQEEAEALVRLLEGQLGHVNLIPVNTVAGTGMKRPDSEQMRRFAQVIQNSGISVSLREERGADIDAACGQLRRQWEGELNESIGSI